MIVVTTLKAVPGRYQEAIRQIKNCKPPKGIVIHEFLAVLGDYDALIVFETPDEETASDFIMKFSENAVPTSYVGMPIEKLKWTK
ncbi:MAG: GYD domain-containing protein [Thermoplasmata archaeon]